MSDRTYTLEELKLMDTIRDESTRCYYCGDGLKKNKRTIDHKTPLFRGGQTVSQNLVVSCSKCNNEKDIMDEEEYLRFKDNYNTYIECDVFFNELKEIRDKYQCILDKHKDLCDRFTKLGQDIRSVQDVIMVMNMNASDGYLLARDLQKLLKEQNEIKKQKDSISKVRELAINQVKEINKTMTSLADTVRNNYRNDVLREIKCK